MIGMARIQSPTIGFQGFQKPVIRYDRMGQNGNGAPAPSPSPSPSPSPAPSQSFDVNPMFPIFPQPVYQPPYLFPVVEQPVVPAATPSWVSTAVIIGVGVALGAVLVNALKD